MCKCVCFFIFYFLFMSIPTFLHKFLVYNDFDVSYFDKFF